LRFAFLVSIVDLKNSPQSNQNPIPEPRPVPTPEPAIRTMQKDLARLAQEAGLPTKKAAPPEKLPMAPRPALPLRPSMPLPPQPAEPEEKPLISAKKPTYFSLKFILITLIFIVIGLGGFLYWWNYIHVITPPTYYQCQNYQCLLVEGEGIDQCFSHADCAPPEPEIPASLISIDETETIELVKSQENLLIDKLKTLAAQEQTKETFRRILIKSINGQRKYLGWSTFCQLLGIQTPLAENNFTLFLYNQTEGNRLGLVLKVENPEQIQSLMRNWETSLSTDLEPIFLDLEPGPAATEEFQDNVYQDVAIRYLNFPNPDLTIDYAVVDDKLVITTSKDSIYAVIDAYLD